MNKERRKKIIHVFIFITVAYLSFCFTTLFQIINCCEWSIPRVLVLLHYDPRKNYGYGKRSTKSEYKKTVYYNIKLVCCCSNEMCRPTHWEMKSETMQDLCMCSAWNWNFHDETTMQHDRTQTTNKINWNWLTCEI